MIFGKTKLELKVGVFVFIGFVILAAFILSIGGYKTWTTSYQVNLVFGFVNGVKLGAPVRFSGVDVGQVKRITILNSGMKEKPKVNITCLIREDIKIPVDSKVWVNTLGLLGEKYIEVMPGEDYGKFVTEGGQIIGEDPLPMQVVTDLAKKIADDLDDVIVAVKSKQGTIGKLLYEDSIYKNLDAFTEDIKSHPWKLLFRGKEKK